MEKLTQTQSAELKGIISTSNDPFIKLIATDIVKWNSNEQNTYLSSETVNKMLELTLDKSRYALFGGKISKVDISKIGTQFIDVSLNTTTEYVLRDVKKTGSSPSKIKSGIVLRFKYVVETPREILPVAFPFWIEEKTVIGKSIFDLARLFKETLTKYVNSTFRSDLNNFVKTTFQNNGGLMLPVKDKTSMDKIGVNTTKSWIAITNYRENFAFKKEIMGEIDITLNEPSNYSLLMTKEEIAEIIGAKVINSSGQDTFLNGLAKEVLDGIPIMRDGAPKEITLFTTEKIVNLLDDDLKPTQIPIGKTVSGLQSDDPDYLIVGMVMAEGDLFSRTMINDFVIGKHSDHDRELSMSSVVQQSGIVYSTNRFITKSEIETSRTPEEAEQFTADLSKCKPLIGYIVRKMKPEVAVVNQ